VIMHVLFRVHPRQLHVGRPTGVVESVHTAPHLPSAELATGDRAPVFPDSAGIAVTSRTTGAHALRNFSVNADHQCVRASSGGVAAGRHAVAYRLVRARVAGGDAFCCVGSGERRPVRHAAPVRCKIDPPAGRAAPVPSARP
jgi:hypothetical protein